MNDDEALQQVREVLADGWCKGKLHADGDDNATGAWSANREASCLLGGIELVAQDEQQSSRLGKRIQKGIRRLLGKAGSDPFGDFIPAFNDAEETTQEDVLLAVKYAEEDAAEEKDEA